MILCKCGIFSDYGTSKKWTMPIQNWKAAMNRFSIMFEERVTKYF